MTDIFEGKSTDEVVADLETLGSLEAMEQYLGQATVKELTAFAETAKLELASSNDKAGLIMSILLALEPKSGMAAEASSPPDPDAVTPPSGEAGDPGPPASPPDESASGSPATGEATPTEPSDPEATESAVIKPDYAPIGLPDTILMLSIEDLESEIRSHEGVILPEDHVLDVDALRDFLFGLRTCGERGVKPDHWPQYTDYAGVVEETDQE